MRMTDNSQRIDHENLDVWILTLTMYMYIEANMCIEANCMCSIDSLWKQTYQYTLNSH